ncbi:MAG: hypothetical protein IJT28_08060 [Bacteroidaceae bacterium]|nr:hypothetical protein [Bacteroidaceae bacterium]
MVDIESFATDIQALIATLEAIEVHGSRNMNMLLGCIQKLQGMMIITEEAKKNENSDHI